jgi:outer membrane lipoprotein-sorting protein
MSIISRYPTLRWAVPVAVAGVAVGTTALVSSSAGAAAPLPKRSAAQLLVDLQTADQVAGSGTVVQKADLGLPALPAVGGSGSSDLSSLVSGNHTLRVWYDGRTKVRLALMGTLGESDVIRNGQDLWTWASDSNSATHRRLPAEVTAQDKRPVSDLVKPGLTPQQLADRALAAISPTTLISTDGTARIAGRNAYELVLAPRDRSSLVGQIRIAVDAERKVPLRVQVIGKNATKPALEAGFTQISFATPASSQFTFRPPPGVKLTEGTVPPVAESSKATASAADSEAPTISGTGWTSVVRARMPVTGDGRPSGSSADRPAAELTGILARLPHVSGTWGSGRLLRSNLVTVLLTDDGQVLAGAVAPERLYELAGHPLPAATATP